MNEELKISLSNLMPLSNNEKLKILKYIEKQDKEIERLKEELEYTIPIVEHNKTITKHLKEIERLNNIINELNNAYCKVITKCEEIIDNRFYMNDNAIKKYADEIKDICKYYVGEAKELKGDGGNE